MAKEVEAVLLIGPHFCLHRGGQARVGQALEIPEALAQRPGLG